MARKQVKSVAGKVVAITGGARGIGKATATALVRRGARVALGDLDAELAEQTATELGGSAVAFDLDVTDRASFERFYAGAERELGPIDVLINNAGIMPIGPLEEESDELAGLMIDINVHGVIFGSKIAMRPMKTRGSGHIVNIASQAGKGGFPGVATYCATKHAVVGFSEALRGELRDTGVEVSCVMPAIVNTELTAGVPSARGVKDIQPEDVAEAIVEAIETNRFDVHVPRSVAAIGAVMTLVPRRGREAIARLLKADRVMLETDQAARAAYEDRAAHSKAEHEQPAVAEEGPADAGSEPETSATG